MTDRPIKIKTADGWQDLSLMGPQGPANDIAGDTHAATSKTTPVDADELALVDSAASYVLKKLTWANLKATIKAYFDSVADGWVDDSAETWTYASGSGGGTATFTVPGDKTAKYTVGTRIKLTQTTVKYFVVSADPVFASGNTTVTITAGSDYTLANAAITNNYHSYAANPQGYPGWFNWNAATTGLSATSTVLTRFAVVGRVCTIWYSLTGTSNAITKNFTLPVAQNASANINNPVGVAEDNGVFQTTIARVQVNGGTSLGQIFRDGAGTNWTTSGTWFTAFSFSYPI